MMDAARVMTAGAVDLGEKPSVLSAIVKYHLTERVRAVRQRRDGRARRQGHLPRAEQLSRPRLPDAPIAITVEGANILTRSLIIFGQGAIRCHPYVLREMRAAKEMTGDEASREFDDAFTSHIGHVLRNGVRALVLGLTSSRLAPRPANCAEETRHYYRHLSRLSAAFAFLADVSMLALGGALKRKERLSGRLGDVLSSSTSSPRAQALRGRGPLQEDLPLLRWAVRDALYHAQQAIDGILSNFPVKPLARFLRLIIFPLGMSFRPPLDRATRTPRASRSSPARRATG